ncbi:hypothetical protein C1I98_38240, partial [Spongiactinospora gelatinilytica]
MRVDTDLSEVLAGVRVLELTTVTAKGGVNTRPMSSVWLPERRQIMLTTPAAYSQKVLNIRRDGRVALLYSDFTGSGLEQRRTVLVRGTATAPDVVAAPQDIAEYWHGLMRRNPGLAEEAADPVRQAAMDWYYWRLPIIVEPQRIDVLRATPAGGKWDAAAIPDGAPMDVQIDDALTRYPSAVFAARDDKGHPYSVRAYVSRSETGSSLRLRTEEPFPGVPGPANLLWHQHNGRSGDMAVLLVAGVADG